MKKVYVMFALLMATLLMGCNVPKEIDKGQLDIQQEEEVIQEEENIEIGTPEEESNDSQDIVHEESNQQIAAESISDEVKSFVGKIATLIKKRETQTTDEGKLTEEDIELMENIIEELKNL